MNKSATPEWLQDNGKSPQDANNDDFREPNVEKIQKGSRCACFSLRCVCLGLISIVLCALFVYAACIQGNDENGLQWIIYYSFSAVLPVIFLVYYMWCFPVLAIHGLSLVTAIWSIVYIVLGALALKEVPAGEKTDINIIYDIGGASVGLFSSLYHPLMAKCCVAKDDNKIDEDEDMTSQQV